MKAQAFLAFDCGVVVVVDSVRVGGSCAFVVPQRSRRARGGFVVRVDQDRFLHTVGGGGTYTTRSHTVSTRSPPVS